MSISSLLADGVDCSFLDCAWDEADFDDERYLTLIEKLIEKIDAAETE